MISYKLNELNAILAFNEPKLVQKTCLQLR